MVLNMDDKLKILVMGGAGVGKSSLMRRFCSNEFDHNTAVTLHPDCRRKTIRVDRSDVVLEIWDTVGQERFNTITRAYYRNAKGVLIVFDVTQEDTLARCQQWIDQAITFAPKDIEIMLLGNKSDDEVKRTVLKEQAEVLAIQNGITYLETSAKTGAFVDKAFYALAQNIKHRIKRQQQEDMLLTLTCAEAEQEDTDVIRLDSTADESDRMPIRTQRWYHKLCPFFRDSGED